MQHSFDNSHQTDICLLLRAHGEHFLITSQVLPVLRQLEAAGSAREDERAAALAYLEVLWLDARCRAASTDAALADLLSANGAGVRASADGGSFAAQARRYHAAVCALRMGVGARVRVLTDAPRDGHAHERVTR
jgi:hypothetical protein